MLQNIRTFRLAPEGFNAERTGILSHRAPLFFLMIVFVLAISFKDHWKNLPETSLIGLVPAMVVAMFLLITLTYGVSRGLREERRKWMSYELTVGQDFLIRRLEGIAELELARDEVVKIKELPRGLMVETANKNRVIFVHQSLIGYEEVKQCLQGWNQIAPVEPTPWTLQPWLASMAGIGTILLFATFLFVRKPWITVATGLSLCLFLLLSLVAVQRSPHLDKKTKRRMLILIFPLAALIFGTANALRETLQ